MRRSFILVILSFVFWTATSVQAATTLTWKDTFYTDDSSYYLKLYPDGFLQRFRVARKNCDEVTAAEIVLKKNPSARNIFSVLSTADIGRWPSEYGIDPEKYCWFEVRVKGLNLDWPTENDYIIKLNTRDEPDPYYLINSTDSVLFKNRLVKYFDAIKDKPENWINLGAMGASLVEGGGVFFKIWEPIAERVDLFLNGKNADDQAIRMQPSSWGRFDINKTHVKYISDSKVGTAYQFKFLKNGKYENIPVANALDHVVTGDEDDEGYSETIKVDPMAKMVVCDARGGRYNGYINPKAIVVDPQGYDWKADNFVVRETKQSWDNWIIYQLWPLAFNPQLDSNGKWKIGTFVNIAQRIDYLKLLGVNAVEFLPVNITRFHASWGYALDSLLALEPNYGSPAELKYLVDVLHSNGIKVIFDIVINHVNNSLIRDPLTATIGDSKFFKTPHNWGPKPDFSKTMVRKWVLDSLVTLVRDYHVDGFRFDMTKYVYNDIYPDYRMVRDVPAFKFLGEMTQVLKTVNPRINISAEELPNNVFVSKPSEEQGLGFDAQWNDLFKNFFERNFRFYRTNNRSLDLGPIVYALKGGSNQEPNGDFFGNPLRTVNYLGSHDFVGNENPILRIVAGYSGREWSDKPNPRVRPLEETTNTADVFRQIHNDFTHGLGRLGYGVLFTKPGQILFYQGEELGNDINIENEWAYLNARKGNTIPTQDIDINRFVGSHRLPWEYLELDPNGPLKFLSNDEKRLFSGYFKFFQDMIKFRKAYPGINMQDAYNVQVLDSNSPLISFQISDGQDEFFVIANFGYDQKAKWIQFPGNYVEESQWWKEVVNTASLDYGASNYAAHFQNIIANKGTRYNQIRIAGPSLTVFQKVKTPQINKDLYLRGTFNNWAGTNEFKLKDEQNGIFSVDFTIPQAYTLLKDDALEYEFKLATSDWLIDYGAPVTADALATSGKVSSALGDGGNNLKATLRRGVRYHFQFDVNKYEYSFSPVGEVNTGILMDIFGTDYFPKNNKGNTKKKHFFPLMN